MNRQDHSRDQIIQEKKESCAFAAGLGLSCAVLLAVITAAAFLFDPFFHYHKPLPGLKAVLTDKEYQVVGTLRTFDYDAVLAGSSVVENNDNTWYDEGFDVTTVKAVRSYGAIADLCWFLDEAFAARDIRRVFFNIDPSSLIAVPQTTFVATGCPMYLYDHNPLNDVKYLWNKTVLFEKIPYMAAQSFSSGYRESLSYNWAEGKDFSRDGALSQYYRRREVTPMLASDTYDENLEGNIRLLENEIGQHPETEFIFFFPPYSALWWDEVTRAGERDIYLHCEEKVMEMLLAHGNVTVYDFQNEAEIVADLDNYMDTVHFTPQINQYMADVMIAGTKALQGAEGGVPAGAQETAADPAKEPGGTAQEVHGLLTSQNYLETIEETRRLSESYQTGVIRDLESDDAFRYGD